MQDPNIVEGEYQVSLDRASDDRTQKTEGCKSDQGIVDHEMPVEASSDRDAGSEEQQAKTGQCPGNGLGDGR